MAGTDSSQRPLFEQFLEFAPDAIVGIGEDGRIVLANRQTEAVFGYGPEELLGEPVEVLVPERFRGAHTGHRSGYFADPRTRPMGADLDLYGLRKDGSEFPAEISLSSIRTDNGSLATAAIRDVSGRRHDEETRRRLAALVQSSDDAIIGKDIDGVITDWNPGAERLYGFSPAEAIGSSIDIVVPPDRAAEQREIMAKVRAGELIDHLDTERQRKDGSRIDVSLVVSPIRDREDHVVGASVIGRDISERAQAERTLEQFLELAPDAMIGVDESGAVVLVNKQTERVFGYDREELLGQPIEILVPERFHGVHPSHRTGYFTDPRTRPMGAELNLYGRRKDGSEFPAEISLSWVDTERGAIATAAVRDISDRVHAERKFEQFLEFAPDAIVGIGRDGRILLVNQQAERLFGYDREELLDQPVETLVPERFHDVHPGHRQGYFDDPKTRPMGAELDLYGRRKDGSEFPAEISLSSIETEDGVLATAAVRDVSDRVQAQRESEALKEQLRQARSARLESIGQLAGGIAHDFNNLLAVIINYADFAAEELSDRPEVRRDLDEVRHAARKASDLTRQLLVFSRREVVKPEPLDLNTVVGEMENLLRRTLGSHVELETRLAPGLGTVLADPGEIEQILVNLAVNARDAMQDGGHLRIRTAEVELDENYTDAHPEVTPGVYVELTVEDSGAGMSAEIASRAFDPFFTTKPKGEGTGLGLATVYGIARQAGGTATIYSEEGSGTAIKVFLPGSAEAPRESTPDLEGPPQGRGENLLVVEDEEAVRRLAVRVLKGAGYTVTQAGGGQEAIRLCRDAADPFDLLLTDVIMPGMLGTETAEHLRALQPGLRVLYMSGYMEAVGASPVVRADLVEKPFSARSLLERVREALDRPPAE